MQKRIFEIDSTKLFRREPGYSHQHSPVLVLVHSRILQQVILMILRNGGKLILDFLKLEHCEPDSHLSVDLPVKRTGSDLLPSGIVVYGSLDDVFGTALELSHDRAL